MASRFQYDRSPSSEPERPGGKFFKSLRQTVAWTAVPEKIMVPSVDGRVAYAVLYPPTSPLAELPADVAGPYVLAAHGGPTGHTPVRCDAEIAYFTSRGVGVAEVNYGGSTGYGRPYRDALRGNWGVVDVEDCEAVASWLPCLSVRRGCSGVAGSYRQTE